MGNTGHKMLGKELKLRGNRKKRLKVVRKIVSHLFGYSGAILERLRNPFIDYSGAKYVCLALSVLRDVITLVFAQNDHKAPPKSL